MKLLTTLAIVASLSSVAPAFAAPVTINFEDQSAPGTIVLASNPYGLSANSALQSLANGDGLGNGPDGIYFSNLPNSGSVVMWAAPPLAGERAEISSSVGFTQSVSFLYSASEASTVSVLDAAGNSLKTVSLDVNSTDPSNPYNAWSLATIVFSGLAHSIDFSDAAFKAAFDDVTVNPVPLPAGLLLLPSGLAALGLIRRRKAVA